MSAGAEAVEERVVFAEGTIRAVTIDGKVWVCLKEACDVAGIHYESQRGRLRDKRRSPWAVTKTLMWLCDDKRTRPVVVSDLETASMMLKTARVRREEMRLYFALCPIARLVKIGVSGDIKKRITALQTQSPVPIVLLGSVVCDGKNTERAVHDKFGDSRHHGEWFEYSDEVSAFIRKTLKAR